MKHSKRKPVFMVSLLLAVSMMFAVTACAGQQPSQGAAEDATDGAKTIVVYYSATGSTAAVANYIVEVTGADSFAIAPQEPYSQADLLWSDDTSRVSREHNDASLQDVALEQETPDNWDSYDTVLVGYPIWWGVAAWPMDSFVKANDFEGKTVIPFCTSASSDLGQSARQLASLANGGEWLGGMRFPSNVNNDEVLQWIDDLGLEKQELQNMD